MNSEAHTNPCVVRKQLLRKNSGDYGMFYRIKDKWNRHLLKHSQSAILNTGPIQPGGKESFLLLSMLNTKDLLMYILAVKSFTRYVTPQQVCIVNDGTLTNKDITILNHHIPGLEILSIEDYRHPSLPKGGTWERLFALGTLSKNNYSIQLDADTLTIANIQEVANAIEENKAFLLGSENQQVFVTAKEASSHAKAKLKKEKPHIQWTSESMLDRITSDKDIRYARGCSAFTGIPKGSLSLDMMIDFSRQFNRLLGERWYEWGTEQFMSNLLISNIPGSAILPHPKYSTCPAEINKNNSFIHFSGYCRYQKGTYHSISKNIINEMLAS